MHYAAGRQFSEFMSKSPGKELQHCSGRSNEHVMCVSSVAGGVGEDVTLRLWASGSRRFESFPHVLIDPKL